jgi:hypothetical protein
VATSGFTIGLREAKAGFFDRPAVQSATDRATNRNLSRFGAFVRTRSRSSIRKRKGVSEPGQPPSSHVGTLKKSIFFSFEPTNKSVVIGPTRTSGAGTAPELLEHGGTSRFVPPRQRRPVAARYRPRPFMTPAFVEEQKRMPDLWRNSVRA